MLQPLPTSVLWVEVELSSCLMITPNQEDTVSIGNIPSFEYLVLQQNSSYPAVFLNQWLDVS